MSKTICGLDCTACAACPFHAQCRGCVETDGCPFGQPCMVAKHTKDGTLEELKARLMAAFNALGIEGMGEVTQLFALRGLFINLEFTLPGGQRAKFWHDDRIYLGSQLPKAGSQRCYGICGDEHHLMVCEYSAMGADPALVVFQRWN